MDGYMVMPALEAARIGDLFIAVTGCKDVFAEPHFALMKDGAILANAGHFDVEVNKKTWRRWQRRLPKPEPTLPLTI